MNNKLETITNLFEGKEIRSIWDNEKEDYYFSVVDVIVTLTNSKNPNDYWYRLKTRMTKEEKSELSTKYRKLKLKSKNEKLLEDKNEKFQMKNKQFNNLIKELSVCDKCTNFKCSSKSLINIYKDYDFCINIPSIWTDWFNRLNASIMIIGQDWGPYTDMKKFHNLLNKDKSNWKKLIESEKSSTKKMLEKYIIESSNKKYSLDNMYITNAIMCARQGENYRGNNIDLRTSTLNCSEYLLRQIEIVKPKVILTLGYYPLMALSKVFNFKIDTSLKETISKFPEIFINNFVIIPLFHPVSQIKREEQLKQYKRIWKYIDLKIQNDNGEDVKNE